jgi:hypothetical protein
MWYYDEYAQRWYIDYEPLVERVSSCDTCESIKTIGIDACSGCAG